jgi:hypothetical protein
VGLAHGALYALLAGGVALAAWLPVPLTARAPASVGETGTLSAVLPARAAEALRPGAELRFVPEAPSAAEVRFTISTVEPLSGGVRVEARVTPDAPQAAPSRGTASVHLPSRSLLTVLVAAVGRSER